MANPVVRQVSIYANNKKVSEQETTSYSGQDGGEAVFGDVPGGFVTYTEGAITTELMMTEIVPVQGTSFDFVTALVTHQPLDFALSLVDGKIHQVNMRCLNFKFDGNVQTGALKGEFTFRGGQPTIT